MFPQYGDRLGHHVFHFKYMTSTKAPIKITLILRNTSTIKPNIHICWSSHMTLN